MKRLIFLTLFLGVSCSSNKTVKQEFSETAQQVDQGVRKAIEEVKQTSSKAYEKLKTKE